MTDFDKEIWEGWTVGDFIKKLYPILSRIQDGHSWQSPITTSEGLRTWLKDNQPYYKRHIPEVFQYFKTKYKIEE